MAYARVFAGTYKCIQIQPFVQLLSLNVQQIQNHVCLDRQTERSSVGAASRWGAHPPGLDPMALHRLLSLQ